MVHRILYLHGAGLDDGSPDPIAQALRERWPDVEIIAPQLPPVDLPDSPDRWQHEIGRAIREMPDEPWALVGHSLGGSEALRFLCLRVPTLLRRIIVVATPFWESPATVPASGPSAPWWGPQWALPAHADRLLADTDVVVIHSEDDPVVPVEHAHRLAQALPCTRLQIAHCGGHAPVDWIHKAV